MKLAASKEKQPESRAGHPAAKATSSALVSERADGLGGVLLAFLLAWVSDYYRRDGNMSLRAHREVFDAYGGTKRELIDESSFHS